MSYAVSGSRGNFWRAARLVFGFAVFACVFGLAGAARADGGLGGLVQYASAGGSLFDQPALSGSELCRERGEGLDAQAPSAPGTEDGVAIILWDEVPPHGGSTPDPPGFGGNGGGSAGLSVSVSAGP